MEEAKFGRKFIVEDLEAESERRGEEKLEDSETRTGGGRRAPSSRVERTADVRASGAVDSHRGNPKGSDC